jgi:cytochrome c oxidase subunit II
MARFEIIDAPNNWRIKILKPIRQALITLLNLSFLALGTPSRAQEPNSPIEVHAKRFAFVPSELTLKRGETVKLQLFSDDVPHSLVIRDLHINQEVTKGHPVDVTITPETVGNFHGECGRFCGSGHGSMVFIIHVKE